MMLILFQKKQFNLNILKLLKTNCYSPDINFAFPDTFYTFFAYN
jgi:hypothetical protein